METALESSKRFPWPHLDWQPNSSRKPPLTELCHSTPPGHMDVQCMFYWLGSCPQMLLFLPKLLTSQGQESLNSPYNHRGWLPGLLPWILRRVQHSAHRALRLSLPLEIPPQRKYNLNDLGPGRSRGDFFRSLTMLLHLPFDTKWMFGITFTQYQCVILTNSTRQKPRKAVTQIARRREKQWSAFTWIT